MSLKLNKEQQEIISTKGNILIIANPGTGKTTLLAHKYFWLLQNGFSESEILCLTFTNKAQNELESRIISILNEENLKIDKTQLNVFTFHSYAMENLGELNIISTNLLRYSIFKFIKENNYFNYEENYLFDKIIPQIENSISYLKSFGFTPDKIELEKVQNLFEDVLDDKNKIKFSKDTLKIYAEYFLKIYQFYEAEKGNNIDYSDMLLKVLSKDDLKKYKYVLVDELQDVNMMEAEIALSSAENFVAVGDKKQAIFGFQGGSILNFEKFNNSKQFILSENYRSTNEILNYSRDFLTSKTKIQNHKTELENLINNKSSKGVKPSICKIINDKKFKEDNTFATIFNNLIAISTDSKIQNKPESRLPSQVIERIKNKKIAIIGRTNGQLQKISKLLSANNILHYTSSVGSSGDAKIEIINFLMGIVTNDFEIAKRSLFTVYSPISIQKGFQIAEMKIKNIDSLLEVCPELKALREKNKKIEDIDMLFRENIIPISLLYGKEYFVAAQNLQKSFTEAFKVVGEINFKNIFDFINSASIETNETEIERNINLITVHKSKGMQFDAVIYLPSNIEKGKNLSFHDIVIETILQSKNFNAKEEIEEESLRIDFVAFTRAKNNLFVLTDKPENYLNDFSDLEEYVFVENENSPQEIKNYKAFNLFLNDASAEVVKNEMNSKNKWLKDYVSNHFNNLTKISFSTLKNKADEYLLNNILSIKDPSQALELGSIVHKMAEEILIGNDPEIDQKYILYKKNIIEILNIIKKDFPELVEAESTFKIPLSKIMTAPNDFILSGKIDAVFRNKENYLIVDWKTSKDIDKAGEYRRQLEVYKNSFSIKNNIPIENIKIGIGFVGLREKINNGEIGFCFDAAQPKKNVIDTFIKHVTTILNWKKDVDLFFEDLRNCNSENLIVKNIIEIYLSEKN